MDHTKDEQKLDNFLKVSYNKSNSQPINDNNNIEPELEEIPTQYILSKMPTSSTSSDMDLCSSSIDDPKINYKAYASGFNYSDLDTLENELGEVYGYYELSSLSYNFDMFQMYAEKKMTGKWGEANLAEKRNFFDDLLDDLELVDEYKRFDAILAICYLVQGCWQDLETNTDQMRCIEENVILLLRCDGFWRTWNLFTRVTFMVMTEFVPYQWGLQERAMDNCLTILCTVTNVALAKRNVPIVAEFIAEMKCDEGDAVIISMLDTFINVVKRSSRSFLLKKILLLVRNLILLSAGDSDDIRKLKVECRKKAGLNPSKEDTILHCRQIGLLQTNLGWNNLRSRSNLMTLAELGEHINHVNEAENLLNDTNQAEKINKSLPWSPKSSIEQIEDCMRERSLNMLRHQQNFFIPMQQKVMRLVQHLHVPLATFHLQEERIIKEYPNTLGNLETPSVERIEKLFTALFRSQLFEELFKAMIMVLIDACPVSNPARLNSVAPLFIPQEGGDEIYFVEDSTRQAEIIVKSISTILILLLKHVKLNHVYQFEHIASEIVAASFIPAALRFLNRDVNRHVFPRPMLATRHPYCPFGAINVDLMLVQPSRDNSMQFSSMELLGMGMISWRNMLSHINLLRILNKVVKKKPSRILMLNMFNAQTCLIRCLNVKDSLFQQYVLKLLKHQCKFLDQDWKRENLRIISAIYHKVRHRLLEDWIGEISSANKVRRRPEQKPKTMKWPWEFRKDELELHLNIISYLKRKYGATVSSISQVDKGFSEHEFENVSVSVQDDLSESFKESYENWIEQEVFNKAINWDSLINTAYLV